MVPVMLLIIAKIKHRRSHFGGIFHARFTTALEDHFSTELPITVQNHPPNPHYVAKNTWYQVYGLL